MSAEVQHTPKIQLQTEVLLQAVDHKHKSQVCLWRSVIIGGENQGYARSKVHRTQYSLGSFVWMDGQLVEKKEPDLFTYNNFKNWLKFSKLSPRFPQRCFPGKADIE